MGKKREKFYRQCELARPSELGRELMTSWIPEKIAKVGNVVRLKDEDGEWTEGWEVLVAYDVRMAYSYLKKRDRDHVNQRKASDV